MENRKYELPFGELIDKLTITQLRELIGNTNKYTEEIFALEHDIDLLMSEDDFQMSARTIRIIFLIAQLNTLIWTYKDLMGTDEKNAEYVKYLKLSHQVNGLKNMLKNELIRETWNKEGEPEPLRTNVSTDGLNYHISL